MIHRGAVVHRGLWTTATRTHRAPPPLVQGGEPPMIGAGADGNSVFDQPANARDVGVRLRFSPLVARDLATRHLVGNRTRQPDDEAGKPITCS